MKIGTVVTATDLNPLYCDFIPNFIKAWSILFPEVDVVIVLIADTIPDYLANYSSNIHLFKPIEGIHTAFQAQCIRLLYPQRISRNEGVLITDMDMLPMNRFYYENAIKNLTDKTFVSYRDDCLPYELPICYNIATPSVWGEMFEGETIEDWYSKIHYDGTHGGNGWSTDQQILIQKFREYRGIKVILHDSITKYNRLDRIHAFQFLDKGLLRDRIYNGEYSDYHCLRPYCENKEMNDFIVNSLFNYKLDLITGERFQELADVYLGEDYKFQSNPYLLNYRHKWKSISSISSPYSNPKIVFCYTEFIPLLVEKINYFENSFVLISHNSDHSITDEYVRVCESDKLIHWFAQNVKIYNKKITPIPIGVENRMWGIEKLTNYNQIHPVANDAKSGVYFYFNTQTNVIARTKCKEILENKGLVFGTHQSHLEYIRDLSTIYKYAIVPEGNGVDTVRLWECLYMNVIPICIRSVHTEHFSTMYPIVLLDSWEDLTLYDNNIVIKDNTTKLLKFSYYKHLINNA